MAIADLDSHGLSALASSTLTSIDVGFRKPNPCGFAALTSLLGCDPGEMLFVGNEEKDVAGARAAGMTSVLLWRGLEPALAWGQHLVIGEIAAITGLIHEGAVSDAGSSSAGR